jgi:hypothetical protein
MRTDLAGGARDLEFAQCGTSAAAHSVAGEVIRVSSSKKLAVSHMRPEGLYLSNMKKKVIDTLYRLASKDQTGGRIGP